MQTAQILGGYSLGGADLLRRAMGKKKAEEMAEHRERFRAGADKTHGIPQEKADEIFDLMEKFAGYGFNKSHAAAYSLLAYHTAWLKVHCAAEFYASNMTIEADNTDKLKVLFQDAQKNFGLTFEPPDVNRGNYRFEPVTDRVIRYGLGAVKGTGQLAVEAIVAARDEGGAFKSLFDFCVRVDRARINKRTVEALIKAGAFDALHMNRAALVATIDRAFEFAAAQEANANQGGLFDMGDSHAASTQEPDAGGRDALGREGAPVAGEDGDRVLFCRGISSTRWRARCAASASGRSRSWWTRANRCCWPASSTTCASSTASAASSRCSSSTTRAT